MNKQMIKSKQKILELKTICYSRKCLDFGSRHFWFSVLHVLLINYMKINNYLFYISIFSSINTWTCNLHDCYQNYAKCVLIAWHAVCHIMRIKLYFFPLSGNLSNNELSLINLWLIIEHTKLLGQPLVEANWLEFKRRKKKKTIKKEKMSWGLNISLGIKQANKTLQLYYQYGPFLTEKEAGRWGRAKSPKVKWSHSVVSDYSRPHGLQPTRLLHPWDFSRQECWSGLPFPSPGDLPDKELHK